MRFQEEILYLGLFFRKYYDILYKYYKYGEMAELV